MNRNVYIEVKSYDELFLLMDLLRNNKENVFDWREEYKDRDIGFDSGSVLVHYYYHDKLWDWDYGRPEAKVTIINIKQFINSIRKQKLERILK